MVVDEWDETVGRMRCVMLVGQVLLEFYWLLWEVLMIIFSQFWNVIDAVVRSRWLVGWA